MKRMFTAIFSLGVLATLSITVCAQSTSRDDVLKASDNLEYVPFILSVDPAKLGPKPVTIYWRVVSTAAPPPAAAPAKGGNDKSAPTPIFAWEQLTTGTATPTDGGGGKISRSFTVLPGRGPPPKPWTSSRSVTPGSNSQRPGVRTCPATWC